MSQFKGKTVLVTGGASGIGAAVAELVAEQGGTVIIADINDAAGESLAVKLGPPHHYIHLDVTKPDAWASEMVAISGDFGGLDVLILNVGVMTRPAGAPILDEPLQWITAGSLSKMLQVNQASVVYGIMAALPHMRGRDGATIMVTTSGAGVVPYPADPLYTMTKYALTGLCCALAPSLTAQGVRILSVGPNGIDTPMCPPDLHEKKIRENSFSTPRFMAEAFAEIYDVGQAGEIWMGGANRAPWRYEPAPLVVHKS
jgi:NAD(P)-dependent dehydrogenase (short-subunit alcohol dehydrogenase family)